MSGSQCELVRSLISGGVRLLNPEQSFLHLSEQPFLLVWLFLFSFFLENTVC